jgi:hypothetical protein
MGNEAVRTTRARSRAAAAGLVALLAVGVGVAGGAPSAAAATDRTCGPVTVTTDVEAVTTSPALLEGADPRGPELATDAIDMDGDDLADGVVGPTDGTIVVTRADGVLTLTDVPPDPPYPGFPAQHGSGLAGDDLDGDGRDELIYTRWFVPGFRQPVTYETVIVRGTTAPGTASIDDVALQIGGGLSEDVDGDGLDDLWLQGTAIDIVTQLPDRWAPADVALAGADLTSPSPATPRYGPFADLDGDGSTDRVDLGSSDGSIPAGLQLSSQGFVPVELGGTPFGAWAARSRLRTIVTFAVTGMTPTLVEVLATCAGAWMRDATALILGRPPIAADYPWFGPGDVPVGLERLQRTSELVRSQTGRGHLIDASFAWFLGRPSDPVGRAWWIGQLRSGARTPERMMSELLGSRERWRSAGSTASGWVDATYPLVYGRTPDPSGRAYWIRQVERLGTARTANRMFAAPEASRFLVRRYAADPDAFGDAAPASVIDEGIWNLRNIGFDRFVADLVASDEHYLLANERNAFTS